jgi:hypothetical protein
MMTKSKDEESLTLFCTSRLMSVDAKLMTANNLRAVTMKSHVIDPEVTSRSSQRGKKEMYIGVVEEEMTICPLKIKTVVHTIDTHVKGEEAMGAGQLMEEVPAQAQMKEIIAQSDAKNRRLKIDG